MKYLVTDTEAECLSWLARIDRANGFTAPETWARPLALTGGRYAIAHPWGRVISPFGIPAPVTLTEDEFIKPENP